MVTTEIVAHIADEWLRQGYSIFKLWRLPLWTSDSIERLTDQLDQILGSRRNAMDFRVLMSLIKVLRPNKFRADGPTLEMPRGGQFVCFDLWCDEELTGENGRKSRIHRRPSLCPGRFPPDRRDYSIQEEEI